MHSYASGGCVDCQLGLPKSTRPMVVGRVPASEKKDIRSTELFTVHALEPNQLPGAGAMALRIIRACTYCSVTPSLFAPMLDTNHREELTI